MMEGPAGVLLYVAIGLAIVQVVLAATVVTLAQIRSRGRVIGYSSGVEQCDASSEPHHELRSLSCQGPPNDAVMYRYCPARSSSRNRSVITEGSVASVKWVTNRPEGPST